MRRRWFPLLALLPLLIAAPAVRAQAPGTLSYQGVLTDDLGQIVPDGSYGLTFRLYDVAVGGAALFTENQTVTVVRGGFSVVLGLPGGIALPFDRTYYLGIQVGADPEMLPRPRLTASPYALSLRLPYAQTLASASPLISLTNTSGAAELKLGSRLDVGGTNEGRLHVYRPAVADPVVRIVTTFFGGAIWTHEPQGVGYATFQSADAEGEGGYLAVYRNDATQGFAVDGNRNGTQEPRVSIAGSAQSAVFDFTQTGNAAVALPVDAVSAGETLDEAGLAAEHGTSSTAMPSGLGTILSRTITVPGAGYCLVIGSLDVSFSHANGTQSHAHFGVSDDPASLPSNQDVPFLIAPAAATGQYATPVTVHGVFTVAAGSHTFYLLGQELSGAASYADRSLTVLFVPTAYGTVTSTAPNLVAGGGDPAGGVPLSPAEISAERAKGEAFHRARVERELGEMRARLLELQQQLEALGAAHAAAASAKER
uniref:DUF4397 domain-containing protein n=1 Tax=Eiseniibacteriota bacterium TaxID=2212470 RepID=A0A832MJC5_UNCEI